MECWSSVHTCGRIYKHAFVHPLSRQCTIHCLSRADRRRNVQGLTPKKQYALSCMLLLYLWTRGAKRTEFSSQLYQHLKMCSSKQYDYFISIHLRAITHFAYTIDESTSHYITCGHLLETEPLTLTPSWSATRFLWHSIPRIEPTIMLGTPYLFVFPHIAWYDFAIDAPSIPRNMPEACDISLFLPTPQPWIVPCKKQIPLRILLYRPDVRHAAVYLSELYPLCTYPPLFIVFKRKNVRLVGLVTSLYITCSHWFRCSSSTC